MTNMRVPKIFRPMAQQELTTGKAVTADKIMKLMGNSGWLYEGIFNKPVYGNKLISNTISYNHTGNGHGKPLPVIMNINRGLYADGVSFSDPISINGDGSYCAIKSVVKAHNYGASVTSDYGWNWQKVSAIPFIPHKYASKLRSRVIVKKVSGLIDAYLLPCIFTDEFQSNLIMEGEGILIDQNEFTIVETIIDLDKMDLERSELPIVPWYWGLKALVPPATEIEIMDNDKTGCCLAISSI